MNTKRLVWNLMYIGAVLCALICLTMIYEITTTQDTSNEWIIWTGVIIGLLLLATGFLYESKYKEEQQEPDILKEHGEKAA